MKNEVKLRHYFRWVNLDGTDPEPQGPYYSQDNLNSYGGFPDEKSAEEALKEWHNDQRFSGGPYVMQKVYEEEYS